MRYDPNTPLHQILDDVHSNISTRVMKIKREQEALRLETILKEIKYTAKIMQQGTEKMPITGNYFLNEYQALINTAFDLENQARISKGYSKLKSSGKLFTRQHYRINNLTQESYGTKSFADDIFEEEFASILAALDAIGTKNPIVEKINIYLTGEQSSGTEAMERVSKKLQQQTMDQIKKAAQKWAGKVIQANIATNRAIKADINRVSTDLSYDLSGKIAQLHALTNGKTFSLKNYSAYNQTNLETSDINYSNKSLGLGDSNLYKSITGSLGLIMNGNAARKILYRGMQILAGESRKPDTDVPANIARHFAHLRFVYELSGAGLLKQDGSISLVDYIIYNDPSSENIAVRDTGSIILEEMNNKNRTNLFSGEVELAASRIFANPLKNKI